MDPFASFRHILEQRCSSCQSPVDARAEVCPQCGALRDDAEETLDVMLDGDQPRIAVASSQNNLSRLLADLMQLERGELRPRDVVPRVEPVLGFMRRWRDDMASMQATALQTDTEREMYAYYRPLSTYMTEILEAYQQAVAAGDLARARELMNSLSDGFFILGELLERYDRE